MPGEGGEVVSLVKGRWLDEGSDQLDGPIINTQGADGLQFEPDQRERLRV